MFSKLVVIALLVAVATAATTVRNPTNATLLANDVNAMKYAVTLENLEAAFYNQMNARFSPADFAAANLPGVAASTYSIFQLIQAHENSHVAFLNTTLQGLQQVPPPVCTYNFSSVQTVLQYIQLAAVFENVGVSAYDGAINTVFDPTYVQVLATIATVEARHASFLNGLNNSMPIFPASVTRDTPFLPATVGQAIAPFLNCSYNVTAFFPQVYKVVPITNIPTDPSNQQLFANDINALNYALFLEHLEAAYYVYGQNQFNAAAFTAAGYPASVRMNLDLISAHETAHASALTGTINGLSAGAAVPPCIYNFSGIADVATYLSTAALLEATGVSAYDGAINTIYNADLKTTAATIATVEARHSSYLNSVTGANNGAVGNATQSFDVAVSPADIVAAVTRLNVVVSCPNNYQATLTLPRVYRLSAASNTTSTSGTSATSRSTGATGGTGATTTATSAASAVPIAAALVSFSALLALF